MNSASSRPAGAALPLALAGLAILYLLAAGGFTLAALEHRISRSHLASVEAFYTADGALQEYLGTGTGPATPVTFDYPAGTATVTAEPLLALAGGDRLYRIRSTGVTGGPVDGTAARTVGLVALDPEPILLPAALAALAGVEAGEGALISGEDAASPAPGCEPGGSVAGALVPEGTGHLLDPAELRGTPPLLETGDPRAEFGRLEWPGWLADPAAGVGGSMDAEAPAPGPESSETPEGEGGPGVLVLEGDPARADGSLSGEGLLVAPGDLELSGGFRWAGLILVGGALGAEGPVAVEGAVVAGLDLLREDGEAPGGGDPPAASRLGPGSVEIRWDSCHAAWAAAALRPGLIAVPATWFELF